MQEIGFTKIAVYEYQSSTSSYVNVYNYTTSNTTGMTVLNDSFSLPLASFAYSVTVA